MQRKRETGSAVVALSIIRNWSGLAAQIRVCTAYPIVPRRIEYIQIDRVFERFSLMRHMRWDREDLSRVDHDLFTVDPKFQRALKNIGDLLIVMAVQRHKTALLHQYASNHDFVAHYELAAEQRIQRFDGDRVPWNVFQLGLTDALGCDRIR